MEIVLFVCLIGSSECRTETLFFSDLTAFACEFGSQQIAAQWETAHNRDPDRPRWVVQRVTCQAPQPGRET